MAENRKWTAVPVPQITSYFAKQQRKEGKYSFFHGITAKNFAAISERPEHMHMQMTCLPFQDTQYLWINVKLLDISQKKNNGT